MNETKIPEDIAALSFEEALDQLRALVGTVERGRPNWMRP